MMFARYSKFIFVVYILYYCTEAIFATDYMSIYPNLFVKPRESMEVSHDYLYIVGIKTIWNVAQGGVYGQKACTGTLIRSDLVLTLAYCVLYDYHNDPNPDTIVIYERPSGNILHALKVFINPNYYSRDMYVAKAHDFGLILVKRSEQNEFPRLPQQLYNFKDVKDTCIMGGYGEDETGFIVHNFRVFNLNNSEVEVFTGRACSGRRRFCLHFSHILPCEADFGTPLICNGALLALYTPGPLVSVISRTTRCLDLYITVFAPVFNVKDWVTQIMEAPTSKLEWLNNPLYVLLLCLVVFTAMGAIYYGLVESLQRTFDPADRLQTQMPFPIDDDKEDEDSYYDNQWVIR